MQLYRKLYSFVYDALVLLTIEQVLGLDNMTNYNIVKLYEMSDPLYLDLAILYL